MRPAEHPAPGEIIRVSTLEGCPAAGGQAGSAARDSGALPVDAAGLVGVQGLAVQAARVVPMTVLGHEPALTAAEKALARAEAAARSAGGRPARAVAAHDRAVDAAGWSRTTVVASARPGPGWHQPVAAAPSAPRPSAPPPRPPRAWRPTVGPAGRGVAPALRAGPGVAGVLVGAGGHRRGGLPVSRRRSSPPASPMLARRCSPGCSAWPWSAAHRVGQNLRVLLDNPPGVGGRSPARLVEVAIETPVALAAVRGVAAVRARCFNNIKDLHVPSGALLVVQVALLVVAVAVSMAAHNHLADAHRHPYRRRRRRRQGREKADRHATQADEALVVARCDVRSVYEASSTTLEVMAAQVARGPWAYIGAYIGAGGTLRTTTTCPPPPVPAPSGGPASVHR